MFAEVAGSRWFGRGLIKEDRDAEAHEALRTAGGLAGADRGGVKAARADSLLEIFWQPAEIYALVVRD